MEFLTTETLRNTLSLKLFKLFKPLAPQHLAVARASPSTVHRRMGEPSGDALTALGPGLLSWPPCRKMQDTSSPPLFWWMLLKS